MSWTRASILLALACAGGVAGCGDDTTGSSATGTGSGTASGTSDASSTDSSTSVASSSDASSSSVASSSSDTSSSSASSSSSSSSSASSSTGQSGLCSWQGADPGNLVSTGNSVGDVIENVGGLVDQCGVPRSLWDFAGGYRILSMTTGW